MQRCEKCIAKGYLYCFMYPHPMPTIKLKAVQREITVTSLEFRDD